MQRMDIVIACTKVASPCRAHGRAQPSSRPIPWD